MAARRGGRTIPTVGCRPFAFPTLVAADVNQKFAHALLQVPLEGFCEKEQSSVAATESIAIVEGLEIIQISPSQDEGPRRAEARIDRPRECATSGKAGEGA